MSKENIRKDIKYLLENVPILYQYMPLDGSKLLLENMTLMVKNPSEFNDPFDCDMELLSFESATKEKFKETIENFNSNIKTSQNQRHIDYDNLTNEKVIDIYKNLAFSKFLKSFGVACFSEKADNSLMWSHYTRSHKGVCIGFDLEKLYFNLREQKRNELSLIRVKYTKEFETIDYFQDYNTSLYHLVKTKSNIWSYEREIRIMFTNLKLDNQNKTLFNFDKSCISEIYLGNKILENDETWIKNFCNKNLPNINLYKMFKPQNSFELIPKSID